MSSRQKQGGGREASTPFFCGVLCLEAILKPLWDARHFEADLKEF